MAADARRIEVHLRDIDQLFHTLDPAPFHDRDLDDDADEFIVGSAKELPRDAELELVIYLDRAGTLPDENQVVTDALHLHFARRAQKSRRDLGDLFRRGRVSLAIGLVFLVSAALGAELVSQRMAVGPLVAIVRESLVIGGWVAMWRPMEIFLYDWWPIRDERRMLERLARMPVRVLPSAASR